MYQYPTTEQPYGASCQYGWAYYGLKHIIVVKKSNIAAFKYLCSHARPIGMVHLENWRHVPGYVLPFCDNETTYGMNAHNGLIGRQ